MAGFAMKQWRTAMAVIEQSSFKPGGTVLHVPIRRLNGKTETATWHLMFLPLLQNKKPRSTRSKLPNGQESNTADIFHAQTPFSKRAGFFIPVDMPVHRQGRHLCRSPLPLDLPPDHLIDFSSFYA